MVGVTTSDQVEDIITPNTTMEMSRVLFLKKIDKEKGLEWDTFLTMESNGL